MNQFEPVKQAIWRGDVVAVLKDQDINGALAEKEFVGGILQFLPAKIPDIEAQSFVICAKRQ